MEPLTLLGTRYRLANDHNYFTELPLEIRLQILMYFQDDLVKRDQWGNVFYIGSCSPGKPLKAYKFKERLLY